MNTVNKTKKGWLTSKNSVTDEVYSLDKTIELLKYDNYYLTLLGRAKNRTLLKENNVLYQSIYKYTEKLNSFNCNNNKFSQRILFLVKDGGDIEKIKCSKCKNNFTSFNYEKGYYNENCLNCFNNTKTKYPTVSWFKEKYGDNWEINYKLDREKIKNKRVGSKEWYIKKYGYETGLERYYEIKDKRIENIINITTSRVSKISQEFFWLLYNQLNDNEKEFCFFHELNNEYLLRDGRLVFFIDFKCGNKVIEYDGSYWHQDKVHDELRNKIYKKNGFDYLIINEKDYDRSNKNENTIIKCLNFIRNGN
jgi:hypothetical protein